VPQEPSAATAPTRTVPMKDGYRLVL
jgi:hypothetical protein